MKATPENTLVLTIASFPPDWKPDTLGFFFDSAKKFSIPVKVICDVDHKDNYTCKIKRFRNAVLSVDKKFKHLLYVDSRDAVFIRPLSDLCSKFNQIGWPVLMSAKRHCNPHIDPGWKARFPQFDGGHNFPNAGVWMIDMDYFTTVFDALEKVYDDILLDKIPSAEKSLVWSDQFVWQAAYLNARIPLRIDHERRAFFNFHSHEMYLDDFVDVQRCTSDYPIVTPEGECPCVAHFSGRASQMMPYFCALADKGLIDSVKTYRNTKYPHLIPGDRLRIEDV